MVGDQFAGRHLCPSVNRSIRKLGGSAAVCCPHLWYVEVTFPHHVYFISFWYVYIFIHISSPIRPKNAVFKDLVLSRLQSRGRYFMIL